MKRQNMHFEQEQHLLRWKTSSSARAPSVAPVGLLGTEAWVLSARSRVAAQLLAPRSPTLLAAGAANAERAVAW